jgi:hypothetical protein
MRYRKLTSDHEPVFGSGRNDFYTEVEAVSQAILTKIKLFQEEWWEDLNAGTPMFQAILGTMPANREAIDRILSERILAVENVLSIEEMYSTIQNRVYTVVARVNTMFGQVVVTNNQGGS